MSKVIFITGKQGKGKTTLRKLLGGTPQQTVEITAINFPLKNKIIELLNDDKEETIYYEYQQDSDNIDLPIEIRDNPNFKWYDCYGVREEKGAVEVIYDVYPFLPF
jgi:ABC-type lipoprotein export system ATPase subunit